MLSDNRHGRHAMPAALAALAALAAASLAAPFAGPFASAALAAEVTVNVAARAAGTPLADTVIVFDPLDATPPPSHEAAIIDQVNKHFVPRVTVIRTGTAVTFPNSDNIRHQVYSFSNPKKFTLKLYAGSPTTPVTFDQPGLVILGCNIHDNMSAFVGIVDSPYFAKTDERGAANLDLPSGRYRLRVWHPHAAAPIAPREIAVDAGALNIPITVDVDLESAAVAAWPE
jgi:plastocyanin